MAAIDDLAQRAVDAVSLLARRGALLAAGVALITLLIAGSSYLTGLAAMSGDVESAWMVLGGVLLVIAVGAPLLAWWRLSRVRKEAGELVAEVRKLMSDDAEAQRIVIETVEVEQPDGTGGAAPAVISQTAQFTRLRNVALVDGGLRFLPSALRAVTTFPWLLVLALLLCIVFGILGFLFLVAWML